MESSLFTKTEMETIAQRLKGNYTDPTGIYAGRIRPKLKEIQAWHTPKMYTKIKKLLEQKHKTEPDDTPAKPNDEIPFEQFRQEIGY